jgi:1-acyl-sn-glycerol-3-phosphate acyltransferase
VTIAGPASEIPRTGPLIIAANHTSNLDGMVVGSWLTPLLGRRIHWLGKKEVLDVPLLGRMAARGSIHPVDRGSGDIEAFRLARRILDDGRVLMVFPEGTRSPTGELQEAKDGLALLALRTDAPILPAGIAGSHRVWPKGSLPRPGGRVTMRIGVPFRLSDVLAPEIMADRRAAKSVATREIMARIAELLSADQRGAYALPAPNTGGGEVEHPPTSLTLD